VRPSTPAARRGKNLFRRWYATSRQSSCCSPSAATPGWSSTSTPASAVASALQAHDRPLAELLERIARQATMRYELRRPIILSVRPDTPFIRSYAVDYVNLSRDMRGTVATSTQIATTGSGARRGQRRGSAAERRRQHLGHPDRDALGQRLLESRSSTTSPPSSPGRGSKRRTAQQGRATRRHPGCHNADLMINRESGIVMVRATARQHEQLAAFLDAACSARRAARS
jgi:MSHA biogenesis protein MshL